MISTRITTALLILGSLVSHQALAQCYAKADACGTGYIAVPKPECEPNAHYACHPDPNYVPPSGAVTGMSLQTNPLASNGNLVIHLSGQNKCSYGFVARDGNGNAVFTAGETYGPATATRNINLAAFGYINGGTYQLAAVSAPGKNACVQLPAPVALNLFTPPVTLSAINVSVHSKDTTHFNSPFPSGSQLTYGIFAGAWFPGCVVDVSIQGPENLSFPGKLLEFTKTYDFTLSKTGNYTITYTTSAAATGSQKCGGTPLSKNFEVYIEAAKFQKLLPLEMTKVKP